MGGYQFENYKNKGKNNCYIGAYCFTVYHSLQYSISQQ